MDENAPQFFAETIDKWLKKSEKDSAVAGG
jgi:hypothetical protein